MFRVDDQWSVNGGVAYYTDFTTRDVTFGAGADHNLSGPGTPYGLLLNQWGYANRASVFNLGSSYQLSQRVRLMGAVEYVKGLQTANLANGDPRLTAAQNAVLAGIPGNFRQEVITTRLTAGVDYQVSRRVSAYFRYVLYDYNDVANQAQIAASTQPVTGLPLSGTSNMFLGGIGASF